MIKRKGMCKECNESVEREILLKSKELFVINLYCKYWGNWCVRVAWNCRGRR